VTAGVTAGAAHCPAGSRAGQDGVSVAAKNAVTSLHSSAALRDLRDGLILPSRSGLAALVGVCTYPVFALCRDYLPNIRAFTTSLSSRGDYYFCFLAAVRHRRLATDGGIPAGLRFMARIPGWLVYFTFWQGGRTVPSFFARDGCVCGMGGEGGAFAADSDIQAYGHERTAFPSPGAALTRRRYPTRMDVPASMLYRAFFFLGNYGSFWFGRWRTCQFVLPVLRTLWAGVARRRLVYALPHTLLRPDACGRAAQLVAGGTPRCSIFGGRAARQQRRRGAGAFAAATLHLPSLPPSASRRPVALLASGRDASGRYCRAWNCAVRLWVLLPYCATYFLSPVISFYGAGF